MMCRRIFFHSSVVMLTVTRRSSGDDLAVIGACAAATGEVKERVKDMPKDDAQELARRGERRTPERRVSVETRNAV